MDNNVDNYQKLNVVNLHKVDGIEKHVKIDIYKDVIIVYGSNLDD